MEHLELPLREWRLIAAQSGNESLIKFLIEKYVNVDGSVPFVLQPIDRDTGGHAAIVRGIPKMGVVTGVSN